MTDSRISLLTPEHIFAIMKEKEANISLDKKRNVIFHVDVNSAFL